MDHLKGSFVSCMHNNLKVGCNNSTNWSWNVEQEREQLAGGKFEFYLFSKTICVKKEHRHG